MKNFLSRLFVLGAMLSAAVSAAPAAHADSRHDPHDYRRDAQVTRRVYRNSRYLPAQVNQYQNYNSGYSNAYPNYNSGYYNAYPNYNAGYYNGYSNYNPGYYNGYPVYNGAAIQAQSYYANQYDHGSARAQNDADRILRDAQRANPVP